MYYGFFDGACNGNPGRIGLGISICDETREIALGAGPVDYGTNNDAEYMSLIKLLESALSIDVRDLTVFGDSQLIVNQVNGKWSAGEKFKPMLGQVTQLIRQFERVNIQWIPRTKNTRADKLSKRGLELGEWKFVNKLEQQADTSLTVQPAAQDSEVVQSENIKRDCEIRIGKKYAVFVDRQTYIVDLRTLRCTCGVASCEHLAAVKGRNAS
jgi:ribonuclease HI